MNALAKHNRGRGGQERLLFGGDTFVVTKHEPAALPGCLGLGPVPVSGLEWVSIMGPSQLPATVGCLMLSSVGEAWPGLLGQLTLVCELGQGFTLIDGTRRGD